MSELYDLALDRRNAPPLWLGPDGFTAEPGPAPRGLASRTALVRAARWITSRRTLTFEQLYPKDVFDPQKPVRPGRLDEGGARGLLAQIDAALAAAPTSAGPDAAQLRSACATVLAHIVATVRRDAGFRGVADEAAQRLFRMVYAERGEGASPALRSHLIHLLQLRAPMLRPADRGLAASLLKELVRTAPPYDDLTGTWRFAMCSAWDFHEGECEVLERAHRFTRVESPSLPAGVDSRREWTVLRAPWTNPHGAPIEIWARRASPSDENLEMGSEAFIGLLVNRHAQLGSFDMRASLTQVAQRGYKLMMNGQCAGMTTRFAISRLFPDADIYSSWDSTYFHTGPGGKVTASEAVDCFVALLSGMAKGEGHASISSRIRRAQWHHAQASLPDFVQFVGPSHPLVVARYSDVNNDGKADAYDGFLDLEIHAIAEDVRAGLTPRDPGVAASQVGGDAARGLGWAAGSLNRVTQYSDLWAGLPGQAEIAYTFQAAGFYSHTEPPGDLPPRSILSEPGQQPSICRYAAAPGTAAGVAGEVMFHAWLAHTGMELKRLLVAAEAFWAGVDGGYLGTTGPLKTLEGRRAMVLLTLAGLLEFPADQNYIDALWSMALQQLGLPDISRSVVRGCITEEDHDRSHYYGSVRGIGQLLGSDGQIGALRRADPVADARIRDPDPRIGRPRGLGV